MNSQKIKEIIKELREYNKNNTDKTVEERLLILKDEYSDFSDNYPRLFEGIVEDSLDDTILNRLLNIMKMKESQQISNHQADVDVGQILVNKYVKQDSST
jgi:phage gp16-like protein